MCISSSPIDIKKKKKNSLDPIVLDNYRPISKLPFFLKTLEKVVIHHLFQLVQRNNVFDKFWLTMKP